MEKQKVSNELTKLVQLNKDSLAEIKSDNQDIYNAMLNVILAIDKKYGADDFLSYVQLDEEITTGGSVPNTTEPKVLATIEESKKLVDKATWWMWTETKYNEYEKEYPNVNFIGMTTECYNYSKRVNNTNYWLKLDTNNYVFYESKNEILYKSDWDDAINFDKLKVFFIAEGTVWFLKDSRAYFIIKAIEKGQKVTVIFMDWYDKNGNNLGERVFYIPNSEYDLGDDLSTLTNLTNRFASTENCFPIAINPLHWEYKKFIIAKVNAELKPPTPPAQPKPPKPKAPILFTRPKLLNLLGSNDPKAKRKMVTLPNGYRAEYDTSTTWSEDWSNKGWRPSPQRSAGGSKSDAVGYGADGNWYEIKTDKNGTQKWAKMKLGSINDLDTLKKYIAKMSDEDIALLVDQKRFYLASTDRDEDEDIYEELDSELGKILGFLESNGYDKYSNS
jgi:hypothetical protein